MIINGLEIVSAKFDESRAVADVGKDGKGICRILFGPAGYTMEFPDEDPISFLDGSMSFEQHLYHAIDAINRRLWDDPI